MSHVKNVAKGVGFAILAAYGYVLLLTILSKWWVALNSDGSVSISAALGWAGIGTVFSLWMTAPLGALLGYLIPTLARRWSLKEALCKGALLGVILGFLGGLLLFRVARDLHFVRLYTTMGLYSAVWVSFFSWRYANRP